MYQQMKDKKIFLERKRQRNKKSRRPFIPVPLSIFHQQLTTPWAVAAGLAGGGVFSPAPGGQQAGGWDLDGRRLGIGWPARGQVDGRDRGRERLGRRRGAR